MADLAGAQNQSGPKPFKATIQREHTETIIQRSHPQESENDFPQLKTS